MKIEKIQKFHKGDLVRIDKDLGDSRSHFTSDCDAIVIGSYRDQFGGDDVDSYTLYLEASGECSWYHECSLSLIETGRLDKLKEWDDAIELERNKKSSLDWIFSNGKDVIDRPHGSSISTLAECLGCTNLWGPHGEGIVYYKNALTVLTMASPFLLSNDKIGWLNFCSSVTGTK